MGVRGSGNSNTKKDYRFIDSAPLPGRSYYRLAQVDFDQKTTHSNVITIKTEAGLVLYPNPATSIVSFNVRNDSPMAIEFYNTLGQKVFVPVKRNGDMVELDVQELSRGMYMINIMVGDAISTHKMVLQ